MHWFLKMWHLKRAWGWWGLIFLSSRVTGCIPATISHYFFVTTFVQQSRKICLKSLILIVKESVQIYCQAQSQPQHSWTESALLSLLDQTEPTRPGIVSRCSSRMPLPNFKGTRGLLRSSSFTKPNQTYQTKPAKPCLPNQTIPTKPN